MKAHRRPMRSLQGPAIFLARFTGDTAPFDALDSIAGGAAGLGFRGVQIPSWDGCHFDLARAAENPEYRAEIQATLARHGSPVTELSPHLQGPLVAVHPAYDAGFDGSAPEALGGKPAGRQECPVEPAWRDMSTGVLAARFRVWSL